MRNEYLLEIRLETETAHRLLNHPGLCRNIHGHSYRWTVVINTTALNRHGMVMDFSELKKFVKKVIDKYDHALVLQKDDPFLTNPNIGERIVIMNGPPTAENMAEVVAADIKYALAYHSPDIHLQCVKVRETTNNEAAWIA
jgi:6-pyruvoyltetrahydropterin/6-carboxytetrahydropterin synthase